MTTPSIASRRGSSHLPLTAQSKTDIAGADRAALRRLRQTYGEIADAVAAGEATTARGWQGRNFDAGEIERRREAIRARGREQAGQ